MGADMKRNRWEQLAPLTGVLAIAVIVIAVIAGGSTPDVKDPASKVLAFYAKHRDTEMNSAFLICIGSGILLLFVTTLRHALAQRSPTARLANASFAGGIVAAAGILLDATVQLALADSAKYGDATVTHTLNIFAGDVFLPMSAGMGIMVLAAGASALRTSALPKWLGVIGVIAGVATFTPIGFPAFVVCLAWVAVTSVTLAIARTTSAVDIPQQPAAAEPATVAQSPSG